MKKIRKKMRKIKIIKKKNKRGKAKVEVEEDLN
jgi:hypothetical protein